LNSWHDEAGLPAERPLALTNKPISNGLIMFGDADVLCWANRTVKRCVFLGNRRGGPPIHSRWMRFFPRKDRPHTFRREKVQFTPGLLS
jgi:hypothetical protein